MAGGEPLELSGYLADVGAVVEVAAWVWFEGDGVADVFWAELIGGSAKHGGVPCLVLLYRPAGAAWPADMVWLAV